MASKLLNQGQEKHTIINLEETYNEIRRRSEKYTACLTKHVLLLSLDAVGSEQGVAAKPGWPLDHEEPGTSARTKCVYMCK